MEKKTPITIRGTVLGAEDKPSIGLTVKAFMLEAKSPKDWIASGETTKKGSFQLTFRRSNRAKVLRAAGLESGAPLFLVLSDDKGRELYRSEPRSGKDRYKHWQIDLPPSRSPAPVPDFGTVLVDREDDAKLLDQLGIGSLADLRTLDEETLVQADKKRKQKIDRTRVQDLKTRANLAAVAGHGRHFRALTTAGVESLRQLALTDPVRGSGSRVTLPPPRPPRTEQATFTALGSSLEKAP